MMQVTWCTVVPDPRTLDWTRWLAGKRTTTTIIIIIIIITIFVRPLPLHEATTVCIITSPPPPSPPSPPHWLDHHHDDRHHHHQRTPLLADSLRSVASLCLCHQCSPHHLQGEMWIGGLLPVELGSSVQLLPFSTAWATTTRYFTPQYY